MNTVPVQPLKICIVVRYLNISKNIWKKIFENFPPKKSNFFKYWLVSNFGPLDFSNGLMNRKTQHKGTYTRSENRTMRTLSRKPLQISIVARYINLSKKIWKKTFENFRLKNPTFSNAE